MPDVIHYLQHLPPAGILAAMFAISYIENVFPPSPSDAAIVFGGTLVGLGTVGFVPSLIASTLGSIVGFLTAYWVGSQFGARILEKKKIKFVSLDAVHKVEKWFRKYGYGIIVVNRFLSGTRAIVSFVAGMARMDLLRTTIFCAISALLWNAILLKAGELLGANWTAVGSILETYSEWVTGIVVVVLIVVGIRVYAKRSAKRSGKTSD